MVDLVSSKTPDLEDTGYYQKRNLGYLICGGKGDPEDFVRNICELRKLEKEELLEIYNKLI